VVIRFLSIILALLLTACSESSSTIASVKVSQASIAFTVQARGELVASESIPVNVPGNIRMGFHITWIAPEYSEVKTGDVVVRFDASQIKSDREYSLLDVASKAVELENHTRNSAIDLAQIEQEMARIVSEIEIAEAFVDVDPTFFSRNEIIDALGDRDYLKVEGAFHDWSADTHAQRSGAERQRIAATREVGQRNLAKQDSALSMMELTSPADGTFVYGRTNWGNKVDRGQYVFAGSPVGLIPKRGKVKAKIYVPEFDAQSIRSGQSVILALDSKTERDYEAKVLGVSPVAIPRRRDDPQKYFVVEALLDEIDADLMRVGSNLTAVITTDEVSGSFTVPQQSIFYAGSEPHVYRMEGVMPVKTNVTLGRNNASLVEITSGLEVNDRVSVVSPEAGAR